MKRDFINSMLFSLSSIIFELARAEHGRSISINDGVTKQVVKFEDRIEVINQLSNRIFAISLRAGIEIDNLCSPLCYLKSITALSRCEIGGEVMIGDNEITISSEEMRVNVLISIIRSVENINQPNW